MAEATAPALNGYSFTPLAAGSWQEQWCKKEGRLRNQREPAAVGLKKYRNVSCSLNVGSKKRNREAEESGFSLAIAPRNFGKPRKRQTEHRNNT